MTDDDYGEKLNELDRLLNDPAVPMQPTLIWRLLGEVSEYEANNLRPKRGPETNNARRA